ncbi:DNA translocase FtsK [Puniceicoccales bacterium CK1056]|uniref:DNA translocase FtsK n=1 Tax=Oceanipulchritudo coccoides TaxID=2706888 RepID=A0A6B2M1J6_9BACT|nr:DNA translocase FtsK [Oceanipulchritudo coccoides]NDV62256.1 DNA translocase FtsK [Oceanipulchritudo coccoides]
MAARKRKPVQKAPTFGPRDPKPRPFLALVFLILGLLMALAVGDYHPTQNPSFYSDIQDSNLIGKFGVQVASFTLYLMGLAAYATPVLAFWISYMFFRPYARKLGIRKLVPVVLVFLSLSVFGSMYQIESAESPVVGVVHLAEVSDNFFPYGWGGLLGFYIYAQFLRDFLGMVGSIVVFGVFSLFSLVFLLFDNVGSDIRHLFSVKIAAWVASREERAIARRERKEARKAEKLARKQKALEAKKAKAASAPLAPDETPAVAKPPEKAPSNLKIGRSEIAEPFEPIMEEDTVPQAQKMEAPVPKAKEAPVKKPKGITLPSSSATEKAAATGSNLRIIAGEEVKKAAAKLPERKGNYKFPPMRLLTEQAEPTTVEDESVHQATSEMLVKTLEEFGVRVSPGDVHTGPVITRYDVFPAPGVRVEKIQNLDKNIALNLKALSVRILAPVPGKGCVGVEVPNKHPQSVFIRDILESADWVNNKAEIPIALGKDVSGKPLIADLTKMPHLLIAGSTGSGKTVCINAVITSLLYHSSPEDLRFVMVDPKIVEMQVYNSLPHMLVPVVTDPKKVPNALKYLLNEMEKRYQLFAGLGVRNIAGYNAKMIKSKREAKEFEERAAALDAELTPEERAAASQIEVPRDPGAGEEAPPEKLPYIVCIVDELADLMMVAPADIETGIARLAQLARAAGIHLILATQRPSVNVITGVIKANLPSRISFKVASRVDSRTILDTMGADHLIGKGDMLFLPPGSADLVRAQGAFVSDDEITAIVSQISEINGGPVFDEQFQRNIESGDDSSSTAEGEWEDELVPDAINVIKTSKRASTSMLQRRLKIGYNRAARIMEILEAEGMVGPENGSSPREILMDVDL